MVGEDALNLFRWGEFSKKVQVIRYDARGHGETQSTYMPDHYRWQHLAEGLKSIRRKTLSVLFKGAALTALPPREVIQSIDTPVLILAWIGDQGHPVGAAAELNALLPQSSLGVAKQYPDIEKWPQRIEDFVSGFD